MRMVSVAAYHARWVHIGGATSPGGPPLTRCARLLGPSPRRPAARWPRASSPHCCARGSARFARPLAAPQRRQRRLAPAGGSSCALFVSRPEGTRTPHPYTVLRGHACWRDHLRAAALGPVTPARPKNLCILSVHSTSKPGPSRVNVATGTLSTSDKDLCCKNMLAFFSPMPLTVARRPKKLGRLAVSEPTWEPPLAMPQALGSLSFAHR
jgi:hypothetical protein